MSYIEKKIDSEEKYRGVIVNVYDEWNKNWIDIAFETVIKRWWKE